MPDINLDQTEANHKGLSKRYRYLNAYVDRHGRKRTYFRRGRRPQIPLPDPESPEFFGSYQMALGNGLCAPRRVRRSLTKRPKIGVYLLIHEDNLIYIGSSKNMVDRVAKHTCNGRPFDRAFYISTTEDERLPLEKLLIKNLRPKQNRAGKPR